MKNNIKIILLAGITSIILTGSLAYAAATILPVLQGGTGWGSPGGLQGGSILIGNWNNPIATSTNFSYATSTETLSIKNLTFGTTTAGCTQMSSTGVVFSTGQSCGTGQGSGAAPFESNTSWGALMQATTSRLAFPEGLISSSTIGRATFGTITATSSLTITPLTSALILTDTVGLTAEYAGAGCTNQVVEDISAVGGSTCVSINNGYWSGTDLSVANGGTGLSTFGGTNTILYTTAADALSSEAAFTYDPSLNKLTADNGQFINATSTQMFYGVQAYFASTSIGRLTGGSIFATSTASVATTSVAKAFQVHGESYISATSTTGGLNVLGTGNSTSTTYIYSKTTNLGGVIILEDADGAGCTEISALNGVLSAKTVTCPTEI